MLLPYLALFILHLEDFFKKHFQDRIRMLQHKIREIFQLNSINSRLFSFLRDVLFHAANVSRIDHTKKAQFFITQKMNPFANILEYLNSAPASDSGRCSYRKVRGKNTQIGRVSLVLKIKTFSVFSPKLTQKFPHLFHWGADPTEYIPFQYQQVQRTYHEDFQETGF